MFLLFNFSLCCLYLGIQLIFFFFFNCGKIYINTKVLAQAAITKPHRLRLEGLNIRHVFLIVLEAGKSKIKVLTESVPGESSLPGLQTVAFSLCPHMAQREGGN